MGIRDITGPLPQPQCDQSGWRYEWTTNVAELSCFWFRRSITKHSV